MSFLTPLYLLGALAVSLPVLFHMIRRTPRDRRAFSSTMFLQPSPPKITRRSRIEHWLLLLLRALAVCLLALAFARPFWRQSEATSINAGDGRSLVVLIDVSASMRRDELWSAAMEQGERLLRDDVSPVDRVAVFTFDETPEPVCSFDQWSALEPGQRADAVLETLSASSPSWRATDLAGALIESAELLDAVAMKENANHERRVVVISDLQSGSRLENLQSYDWPKGVSVELRPVGDDVSPNNAGIHVVADSAVGSDGRQQRTRVRIVNAEGADRDEFTVRWIDEFDTPATEPDANGTDAASVSVIVPAGQSRIVKAAPRPEGPGMGRLLLSGDDDEFDNICYVPPPQPRSATVAILSDEAVDDPQGMRFYLSPALPSLPQRQITVVDWDDADAGGATPPHLVTVTTAPTDAALESLRAYAETGGTILFAASSAEMLTSVFTLLDVPPGPVDEAESEDYAMLTGIDFSHPLFAPLSDARFSDFTKVRFWKHRQLPDDLLPGSRVVARFDDGDAAVLESPLGAGRVIVMMAGWQPADSQLAVSSKFVPMLNGLVDDVAGIMERRSTYLVGEPVSLAEFDLTADEIEAVRRPDGERITVNADATTFTDTQLPGVYMLLLRGPVTSGEDPASFAVNLDPSESRTSRMSDEVLQSAGVRLMAEDAAEPIDETARRQLQAGELEQRQKLWRWLVLAVILLLMAETVLASRAARRQLTAGLS